MASLVRWDPFNDLVSLQGDMARIFPEFGGWMVPSRRRLEGESVMLTPMIDVMKHGDDMVIRAEVPGVKPEDIDISVTEDMLTLKGERREDHETKDEDYYVRERSWGSFERTIRLPESAQVDSIKAESHDGVLEITVPKAANVVPQTHHVAITAPKKEEHPEHH